MQIKVVGPGCKNCKTLLETVKTAVAEEGLDAEVLYVTDMAEIAATGVMRTPGLIVDNSIKVVGRVPNLKEMKKILQTG